MAETHPRFDVAIVTPEGDAFRGEAEMLVVPGAAGDIGVLARHAPLVATLRAGSTRVYLDREADKVVELATGPGFFKVELDRAIALVDDAVDVKEVDDARAQEQLEAGPPPRRPLAARGSPGLCSRTIPSGRAPRAARQLRPERAD